MTSLTRTPVSRREQADHIMQHFDFAHVARAMQALDWRWAGIDEYPTVAQLKEKARYHLDALIRDPKCYGSSSGGFCASVDPFGQLNLAFVVTDWDACDYCAIREGRDI